MRELEKILGDEFAECLPLFDELFEAVSRRLAARVASDEGEADEIAYIISAAFYDNHWTRRKGLIRYFARRVREFINDDQR